MQQKWFRILVTLWLTTVFTSSYASLFPQWQNKWWKPIGAIAIGASSSSDMGQSQNFPIQNPTTDEFYLYSANHSTQTSSLFSGFIGAEKNFKSNWLLDVGVDYNQSSPFSVRGTYIQGVDPASQNSYCYNYNIIARQILLETKLLYSLKKCYHPYFLAGLGASFNTAYQYNTNVPSDLTFTRVYSNNTSTSFSYAVGMGIDMDINSYFRLGIGYRFADLGNVQLGSAFIDNIPASGTLSQCHFYTNELLTQLTFILN